MNRSVVVHRVGLAFLDCLCITLALLLAFEFRFEFSLRPVEWNQMVVVLPVYFVVRCLLFHGFHLYSGVLRYVGLTELRATLFAVLVGSFVLGLLNRFGVPFLPAWDFLPVHYVTYLEKHPQRLPWSIFWMETALTFLLVGGMRLSRRVALSALVLMLEGGRGVKRVRRRVLIVGAGDTGEATARTLMREMGDAYRLVAFVDDSVEKQGCRIRGVRVEGTCADLKALVVKFEVDDVLFAVPSMSPDRMRGVIEDCGSVHVGFKRVPAVSDIVSGRVAVNAIRQVEIEDLLGREPVRLDLSETDNYVRGRVVLISGAGGSIGSELCRQLCGLGVRTLVLLGKGENSVYEISQELGVRWPEVKVYPAVADVRDRARVSQLMDQWMPEVVFHAAAHKHVPLMEFAPEEAIKNNVFGTLNMAEEALAHGVRRFILISTDKAVRPTSVMGASKRVAEMILFNRLVSREVAASGSCATQFVAVRFGNVLGSRGSVVPLFRRQIAAGGPVTVTHPDVTRFFMTIPEAVSLVIQAGSRPEQRRLYLLDMGQPVKIADLAANVIRLSGFEPGRDIRIEFTGMRPGEKLYEELLTEGENIKATDMGRIFCAEPDDVDVVCLDAHLGRLRELAELGDSAGVRRELESLVPDFGADQTAAK